MRSYAALLSAAALATAVLCVTAAPAHAHAVLVASSPVDGARVESAPAEVTLTFDESVSLTPTAAQVFSTDGARADTGSAHLSVEGTTILIPLRRDLPRGSYAATWRVVSADTHVVSGSITFGIGQDAGAAPPVTAEHARSLTITADAARGVVYLGLLSCAGVALITRMLWPWAVALRRVRVLLIAGWVALAAGTLAQFLLQGPQSSNRGWSEVLSIDAATATLSSRIGVILVLRAVLIGVLGAALPINGYRSTAALGACAVGVAMTVVLDGHAAVGQHAWLAIAVTTVHVMAMTIWLGGLIVLCLAVLPCGRLENLRRWSLLAFVCVATLILTGTYQAWRQVRPIEAMWSTDYGITLSVKLVVVTAMLVLAYLGQRRLQPKTLQRTVPAEMALGLAAVAITTALVSQAPARVTYGPPTSMNVPLDARSALVRLDTTRHGPTQIAVTPHDTDGHPLPATSVRGVLSSDAAGIPALDVAFHPDGDRQWTSMHAVVPLPGEWTLRLTVEFTPTDAIATTTHFRIW